MAFDNGSYCLSFFVLWLGTRNEVCRDSGGRGKNAMKRISSAGNPLDHDEPVKETSRHDPYKYSSKTTKTFVSVESSPSIKLISPAASAATV